MWWFILYLFAALQVAACVIAAVGRIWTLRPDPIVWRGTEVAVAAHNVERFLIDVDDSKFAYPTGMFVPAPDADTASGRVIMREENFQGSRGFAVAFGIFRAAQLAWERQRYRHDANECVQILAYMVTMGLAGVLAGPFLLAAVLDMLYRGAFRSRITADVTPHPEIDDAVEIRLEFRGLSAFGLVDDVIRGMTAPARPTLTTTEIGQVPATSGRPVQNRFLVIYGSAVSSAFVIALVLALAIEHPAGDAYSGGSYAAASSDYDSGGSGTGSSSDGAEDSSTSSYEESSAADENADESVDESARFEGDGYSIVPPEGWRQDSADKAKSNFTESRWHPEGIADVSFLVDRRVGYSGSAEEGARGVRQSFLRTSGYEEHEFASPDGDQWVWEFSLDGIRKIDIFTARCGDGYAVLGQAPEDEFEDYRETFLEAAASLRGDCESDDEESTDDDVPGNAIEAPATLVGDDQQVYPTETRTGAMERTIRRHFQARLDGDFETAYGFYAGPLQQRAGSRDSWAAAGREDGLQSVTIDDVEGREATDSRGRLNVRLTTESAGDGCNRWTIRYTMRRVDGRWRMWSSKAGKRSC